MIVAFVKKYWSVFVIGLLLIPRVPSFAYHLYDLCYSGFGFDMLKNIAHSVPFRYEVIYFMVISLSTSGLFIRNKIGYTLVFGIPISTFVVQFVLIDPIYRHWGIVFVSVLVTVLLFFKSTRDYFNL